MLNYPISCELEIYLIRDFLCHFGEFSFFVFRSESRFGLNPVKLLGGFCWLDLYEHLSCDSPSNPSRIWSEFEVFSKSFFVEVPRVFFKFMMFA